MRQEIIIGVERRRRWSIDQKVSILSEIGVGGAKVADVARRHDVRRQHIYQSLSGKSLNHWNHL